MLASRTLHFPVEGEVPETKRHLELRTLLYQYLKLAFAEVAAIGCDQFVYWDPSDPRACLAPDAFVRLGEPNDLFRSWQAWERGAPEVAVEILSDSDERDADWDAKLARYRALGVAELVRFDPDSMHRSLRVWDRVQGELLERPVPGRCTESRQLGGFWVALEQPETGLTLRLSHDELGARLLPTLAEREADGRRAETKRAQAEAKRAQAEAKRAQAEAKRARAEAKRAQFEAEARQVAEQRVRELEAQLRRRSP